MVGAWNYLQVSSLLCRAPRLGGLKVWVIQKPYTCSQHVASASLGRKAKFQKDQGCRWSTPRANMQRGVFQENQAEVV